MDQNELCAQGPLGNLGLPASTASVGLLSYHWDSYSLAAPGPSHEQPFWHGSQESHVAPKLGTSCNQVKVYWT